MDEYTQTLDTKTRCMIMSIKYDTLIAEYFYM